MSEIISFSEFKKIDLRIGRIIKAEKIPRAKKLLLLHVELGEEKRTLVAGLAEFYSPDELVGKEIIVVANLQPKKMMGYVSQGMLLAAVSNGKPVLLVPEKDVPPGTKVE